MDHALSGFGAAAQMWSHWHLSPAQVMVGLGCWQHHQNAAAALGRSQVLRGLNPDTQLAETRRYSHPASTQHSIHRETPAFQLPGLTAAKWHRGPEFKVGISISSPLLSSYKNYFQLCPRGETCIMHSKNFSIHLPECIIKPDKGFPSHQSHLKGR